MGAAKQPKCHQVTYSAMPKVAPTSPSILTARDRNECGANLGEHSVLTPHVPLRHRAFRQSEVTVGRQHVPVRKRFGQQSRLFSAAGFTLTELMVAMAVAAIMLVIAIPAFQAMFRTNRLAAITNELSAALQFARSEAITRGQRVTVCKSSSASSTTPTCDTTSASPWQGWVVFVDNDQDGIFDAGEILLKVGQPSIGNASIAGNTPFANYVSFLPSGISRGSTGLATGTLSICVTPDKRDMVINSIGRLRIDQGTCP